MKKTAILILIATTSMMAMAQEKEVVKGKQRIEVKGNCGTCKKTIEKAAFAVKGVRSVEWTAESQEIALYINPKKTTTLEVEKAIAKSGYDTKHIKAQDEDYNNLSSCCKYER